MSETGYSVNVSSAFPLPIILLRGMQSELHFKAWSIPTPHNGVESAEDPEERNRIIIAVVASVVGLGVIAAVWFFYLRRINAKKAREPVPAVYPPIHPDMMNNLQPSAPPLSPPTQSIPSPGQGEGIFTSVDFNRPLTPEQIQDQEERRARFIKRQQTFKAQRDKKRKSVEHRGDDKASSPSGDDAPPELVSPSNRDEETILQRLNSTIGESDQKKHSIYRDLALQWHPDKRADDTQHATKVFQFIQSRKGWYLGKYRSSLSQDKIRTESP